MDILLIIRWWVVLFLLSVSFMPFTFFMFEKYFDKGYIFTKTVGLIILSFSIWLLSSCNILSFASVNLPIILVVFFLLNVALVFIKRKHFAIPFGNKTHTLTYLKKILLIVSVTELSFFVLLLFWAYIRGHNPAIAHLDHFMDNGFIMAILRTDYMPPQDIWYAGESINYYYFGHFICATLIKLSGVAPEIGFNLWIATLFSMIVVCSFTITGNIMARYLNKKKPIIISGLIATLLMAFGSNLHTFFEGIVAPLLRGENIFEKYWFADAANYIGADGSFLPNFSKLDMTRHEFPSYSVIVGDLHAHFIGCLSFFTVLALLIAFYSRIMAQLEDYDWRKPTKETLFFIILMASAYIGNQWDYPIYGLMVGVTFLVVHVKKFGWKIKTLYTSVICTVVIAIIAFVLVTPFHLHFSNIINGIGSGIPKLAITMPDKFLIVYGHFLFVGGIFVICIYKVSKKNKSAASASDIIACMLFFCSLVLILIPEFIYVRDDFERYAPRFNTMMKLTYRGYILFTIAIGYSCVRIKILLKNFRHTRWLSITMTLVISLPLLYPIPKPFGGGSIDGHYGITLGTAYKGLDGMRYMQEDHPDDYKAVQWLQDNVKGQPVLLEADGQSFTYYGRISMATGLPTVLGCYVHESLWRGAQGPGSTRSIDVQSIYESNDVTRTQSLIDKYNIAYIVIGELEYEKFNKINVEKLIELGQVVFVSNETMIVQTVHAFNNPL